MNIIGYSVIKGNNAMGFSAEKPRLTRQQLNETLAFITEHPDDPKAKEITKKWQEAIDNKIRKQLHTWLNTPQGQKYLDKQVGKDRTLFKQDF
jgi:hypothetical protein